MAKKKKKKWIRPRHRLVRNILNLTLGVFTRIKYGIRVKKFAEQEKRPYLVLYNHQTTFDQFFVGMAFKGPIYYLASEDLFSNGWVSSLIRYLVAPIPIKKHTTDVRAILNCMKVAKEGGSIALAPEGNRTYSGKPCYIKPSVVSLVKALKLPLILYRIEGGYGAHPRWSDVIRVGPMRSYVYRLMEYDEYSKLTDDELYNTIVSSLYVEEKIFDVDYVTDKGAEYLERAIYVCPECGLSELESAGDKFTCKKCGLTVTYNPNGRITKDGETFRFESVKDWYDYQNDYVNSLDLLSYKDKPISNDKADLYEVILYKNKKIIAKNIDLILYGDRLVMKGDGCDIVCDFEHTSVVTCLGRNKLNIYFGDKVYQLKSGKRFSALKYMNMFHRYKNLTMEVENAEFLGI